jgi:parallel beta-helix repeat protein
MAAGTITLRTLTQTGATTKGSALTHEELDSNFLFLQSGSGATSRTMLAKAREIVSVTDFGATGDGTTDDSSAISAAATAASGKRLYFPTGTYIGTNISLPGDVEVYGKATLKLKQQASLTLDPFFRLTAANVSFEGLTFDGNKASQPSDGFSDSWNTGGNNTGKSNRAAIYGDNSGTGYTIENVQVRGCHFKNQWGSSVALRNVSTVIIDGNTFEDCNFECAFLYAAGATRNTGARIVNNICTSIGSGDGTINANAFVTTQYDGVVCSNNQAYTIERNLLKMEDCTRCSIVGNVLDTNTVTSFNCLQVQTGGVDIVVVGNVFKNVQRGIYMECTGTLSDVVIEGNTVEGGIATSSTPDGITVIGGERVTIANNTIRETERHGILISDSTQVVVANNNISANASQALQGVAIYGVYTANGSDISITGNVIGTGFEGADATGSGAISIEASGFTISRCVIRGNFVRTLSATSTERGIRLTTGTFNDTIISENYTNGIIETDANVITLNNYAGRVIPTNASGNVIGAGSAAPSTGSHFVGEIQYNSAPARGEFLGWICTSAGSPGTWLRFGNIVLEASATYNPGSLNDGEGTTTTVGLTGAALGDYASASFSLDLQGITVTAWVSSANTVSVRFQNESGGVLDIDSGTLRVRVEKP